MRARDEPRAPALAGGIAFAAVLAFGPSAFAATLDGSVRLSWSETDFGTIRGSNTDHAANLSLTQVLTPYLRLRFLGNYGEQTAELDGAQPFERSSLQPAAELLYSRPGLSWRLGWENRRIESSSAAQEFESDAVVANLTWQPRGDFRLGLSFRDATNQTDVAALGRDLDERQGRIDAVYQRRYWSLGYAASYNELVGGVSGFDIEQLRQDLRLSASRDFADGRLVLGFSGNAGRLEAEERRGDGDLAEPLPAAQGLFAIDTSPAIGELDAAPGLVDGDFSAPTSPPIEVGGANSFRNIGLDLGLPRPATRFEVAVDRASGVQVVWDVYQSADGLIWQPVTVLSRTYETDLLRYTMRFAATSERYLKAVNVSSNPATDVRVTEVRALREIGAIEGPAERTSELYRAAASLGWQVTDRVTFDAAVETNNDSATVGDVVRRDYTASGMRAGVEVDLPRDFVFGVRYRHSESEERRAGGLTRISDDYGASLRWTPLRTVDALLSAGVRTDSDEFGELSNLEVVRLMVSLDLLDELQLVTDLSSSTIDSQGAGGVRDTLTWVQRIEMRPRENWRVSGGYSWQRIGGAGNRQRDYETSSVFADIDWSPGSALTVRGSLTYSDETTGSTLRQSYGLFWAPGPKLSVSLGWDQFEQQDGLLTASDSVTVNYQAASRLLLFASISRSRNDLGSGIEAEITSGNAGASISF
jgi:hypothetical protein